MLRDEAPRVVCVGRPAWCRARGGLSRPVVVASHCAATAARPCKVVGICTLCWMGADGLGGAASHGQHQPGTVALSGLNWTCAHTLFCTAVCTWVGAMAHAPCVGRSLCGNQTTLCEFLLLVVVLSMPWWSGVYVCTLCYTRVSEYRVSDGAPSGWTVQAGVSRPGRVAAVQGWLEPL